MLMARAVDEAATSVAGKKALAVTAFAKALRQLPTILADNAGLDSADLVSRLRKAMYEGETRMGLDLLKPGGGIADMRELGIVESYKLKRAVVSSASEAAEVSCARNLRQIALANKI
jgi:T-complex protein 1 subunit beta